MAGSSSITLFRSEDATIALQFEARQAARRLALDLTGGTLRVEVSAYPSEVSILTLTPAAPVSGCVLTITDAETGQASLFIPLAFWTGRPERRFSFEVTLISPDATQRLGEQTIDLAE